ncbi:Hypothetical Protein PANA_3926 [Pantoea ananatis LMG 20103]|uniref:Uncharacterized protein n=1 Tax=Pantoea ananatis (strain LMG 20103) TaxID=706191 RepID=D4GE51_PANAM|nr:hypothetical protein [Pantoea ananatis]ADD79093.1 Hypothetical Protein PANA_3926 [Pantoea ananatis LMG 20103]
MGYYNFSLLQQKGKAEAELEEIHTRIKNSESTTVNLKSVIYKNKTENSFYIYPTVVIKNNGKEEIALKLDKSSLVVSKVYFENAEAIAEEKYTLPFFKSISQDPKKDSEQFTMIAIPVDAERTIPYAIKVKNPGTYYITFTASALLDKKKKTIDNHVFQWFTSEYINVE